MTNLAQVKLWGSTIGAVVMDEATGVASFEYDEGFANSTIELAPLTMPLPGSAKKTFRFPGLARQTFHGLPGLMLQNWLPLRPPCSPTGGILMPD